ncbi:hypothetical protein ACQ4PT_027410 [Festuca glaucescens]
MEQQGLPLAAAASMEAPATEVGGQPLLAMAGVVEAEESFSMDPLDWANLFPELVRLVANDLLRSDVTEYIRLRAVSVCKPWRSATAAAQLEPRFFPRNWQLLRGNMLGEKSRFVNVLTGAFLKVQIPPQYGRVVASADGCLVLEDNTTSTMRLLNPMTMAVADLPYPYIYLIFVDVVITAAGIVSDGGEGEALTVVVCITVGDLGAIYCAKPGDITWRLVDAGIEEGEVPMFDGGLTVGGSFYVPKRTGDVLKVVLLPEPRLEYIARLQDGLHMNRVGGFAGVRFFLVPSLDDTNDGMLLVRGLYENNQVAEMDVFQVNLRNMSITELGNIGNRILFLPSLTLLADKFPILHGLMGMLSDDDVEMYIGYS